MKPLLFLIIFYISQQHSVAQVRNSRQQSSCALPDTATRSLDAMANYINDHCHSPSEKIVSIYHWVTANIKFDTDSNYYFNWSKSIYTIAEVTLKRRKGVCENYAAIFTTLLLKTGIPSYLINGYTKLAGNVTYTGHSWTAVSLNNKWYLCDPTWDNGTNVRWLLVSPETFIETHMPFDPMWQLLNYPVTHKEFKQNSNSKKDKAFFDFNDSVKTFLLMDSLQQLEALTRRMLAAGMEDNSLKLWHSYNEMKIAIIYGDRDMELYNEGVDLLNKASAIFNEFVKYRNKQFMPARPDGEIAIMLEPVNGLINEAKVHIDHVGLVVENFQYDTEALNRRLDALKTRVKEQQDFINSYLHTKPMERIKLFLK